VTNPVKRIRAGETVQVVSRHAVPVIRKALRAGGTCTIEMGARSRTLTHDPGIDAPRKPLPWPLRLFQRHTVRYVVYEDVRRVSSHIFVRRQMDRAIGYFLRDVDPDTPITVQFK
jgi:hypothetical protein